MKACFFGLIQTSEQKELTRNEQHKLKASKLGAPTNSFPSISKVWKTMAIFSFLHFGFCNVEYYLMFSFHTLRSQGDPIMEPLRPHCVYIGVPPWFQCGSFAVAQAIKLFVCYYLAL